MLPEPAAERTVGVGEGIHHTFGVLHTVTDPVTGFELRPYFSAHGLIDQFVKMRPANIPAVGIQQGSDQDVLLVRCEIEGQALIVELAGESLQARGRLETADNFDPALGSCGNGCGPVFGARERRQCE